MESTSLEWTPRTWRDSTSRPEPDLARRRAPGARRSASSRPSRPWSSPARRVASRTSSPRPPRGSAFLLQAGDCAESFDEGSADAIRDKLKVILQMAVALTYAAGVPVIKVGRIAGQFAKPRTDEFEERDGVAPGRLSRPHRQLRRVRRRGAPARPRATPRRLPPERLHAQPAARLHDRRLRRPLSACTPGTRSSWPTPSRASATRSSPTRSSARSPFMRACGIDLHDDSALQARRLLHQPRGPHPPLRAGPHPTRLADAATGTTAPRTCCGSATARASSTGRTSTSCAGVANPLGLKVGPTMGVDELRQLVDVLNPDNVPGRLTLISRMGHERVERTPARRSSRRCATTGAPSSGRAIRCTATPSSPRAVRRRVASTTCSSRPRSSSWSTRRSAPGRAGCTSSSPATTSPSASAAARGSNETDLERQLHVDLRPAPQRDPEPRHGLPRGRVPPALRDADRREVVVAQEALAPSRNSISVIEQFSMRGRSRTSPPRPW